MTLSSEKEITAAIRAGGLQTPVLIYGGEAYLKQQYLHDLIGPEEGFSEFNDIRMDFNGLDPAALLDAVTTLPLMAPRKTVLVYDVEPKAINADMFKKLEAIMKELPDECCLILLEKSGAIDDKRDEKSKKLIKLTDKYGTVFCAKERTEAQLIRMIKADAEKRGCTISAAAEKILVGRCGKDITALKSEMEKLCAYRQSGNITPEDVERLTVQKPEDNIYGLSRAILRGDYDGAMGLLSDLFYLRYPPENILGTLSGCFVDLCRARAAMQSRKSAAETAADFGYGRRTFAVENAMRDQKRLGEAYLLRALEVLSQADLRLKSTQSNARMVLEEAVTALFLQQQPGGSL